MSPEFPEFPTGIPDALTEPPPAACHGLLAIRAFFRRSGKSIIALTVKEILDEEIAKKLA
jgi:hypothetical protein